MEDTAMGVIFAIAVMFGRRDMITITLGLGFRV